MVKIWVTISWRCVFVLYSIFWSLYIYVTAFYLERDRGFYNPRNRPHCHPCNARRTVHHDGRYLQTHLWRTRWESICQRWAMAEREIFREFLQGIDRLEDPLDWFRGHDFITKTRISRSIQSIEFNWHRPPSGKLTLQFTSRINASQWGEMVALKICQYFQRQREKVYWVAKDAEIEVKLDLDYPSGIINHMWFSEILWQFVM